VPAVTVALTDSVDPTHAPVPQNDAERIVFGQLYETLVRFDCQGRPLPGLAESWTSSEGGRRWTLTLRTDAAFWDGAPVTARDVVVGKGGAGYTLSATSPRVVTVDLARGSDAPPTFLADPALAVMKPAPDRGWPIGTGRYWVSGATATAQEIRTQTAAGDTLVFRLTTGRDARDLLDAGVDLLITRDRAVLDYAATQARFVALELPWDRTYALLAAEAPSARLDGLEQAVRGEARRADGPFWWERLEGCGAAPTATPAGATGRARTVFPRPDGAARDLAGRIAALTHGVSAGLASADFAQKLAAGSETGYVVALPRQVADPCRAARDLLPPWPSMIAALVDTRPRAVVRRGGSLWVVDWDGTVRLSL
jgi:Bacterial extracellular solute-binding proteins, family 5 Middle